MTMKLIPYISRCIYTGNDEKSEPIYKFILFLDNGGKTPVQIDSVEDVEQFFNDNEIFLKDDIWQREDTIYAPVDLSRTNLNDFYFWTDLQYGDTRECWRIFYKMPALVSSTSSELDPYMNNIMDHMRKADTVGAETT
jgi:hypothetical protein